MLKKITNIITINDTNRFCGGCTKQEQYLIQKKMENPVIQAPFKSIPNTRYQKINPDSLSTKVYKYPTISRYLTIQLVQILLFLFPSAKPFQIIRQSASSATNKPKKKSPNLRYKLPCKLQLSLLISCQPLSHAHWVA